MPIRSSPASATAIHKTMLLGSRDWDVIIFDEAHKLSAKTWSPQKTEKTLGYRLAEDLEGRCQTLLLLTGTPHQGDESKFENLMSLLHENITFEEFAGGDGADGPIPFTDLVLRNRKSKVTDAEGNPIFKGMEVHPIRGNLLDSGEKKFHKALEGYLREGYGYADQDPGDKQHKAIGFVMTTFQKLAASSTRAIKRALQKRLDNLRHAIEKRENQRKVEHDARHEGEHEERQAEEVTESFVEAEAEMIENLIGLDVLEDAKQAELFAVIDSVSRDDARQRVLIFSEYLGTQEFLVQLLEDRYGEGCTSIIRGGMTLWDKRKSMEAFRDNSRVRFLVSTEAGGEGIKNAERAYEMAYSTLFSKDISPFNPERFKHEIQSPLTLEDVLSFVSEFVKQNGRNFTQSSDGTAEFLLPQCLKDVQGLEKRYSRVTFERQEAIRHSELEFMALGHPFTDAAIQHCGSVDFGGLATCRQIKSPSLSGMCGLQCNFIVKLTKSTPDGEAVSFDLASIFVTQDGIVNVKAAESALRADSVRPGDASWANDVDLDSLYELAQKEVFKKYQTQGVWDEDLFCLNAALVEFE